ncbi:pyridoxine/pyridoxamine 5'-phosphate oxidase [Streptomyces longispororuber]|uniref:pyridoxine/pyridoxamine 5'-phosphate oxidase n=1 Tax=Streptomyces longispororuber TaxID=68230 RepID=UPI00210DD204|nr:pyridoxal 5'-phosphate synthase [Streptomyces longispororuber]MCQ4207072.1 pyridoxal 5'-phosphate synthase [Streptomyces longispororuber]
MLPLEGIMDDLRQLLRGLEVFAGELPVFDPAAAPGTPAELFTEWLLGAVDAGVREPHAMTLSTAGADGNPQARTLILKAVTADGWQFASDGGSVKARDLAARPYAALTFYWSPLARQVRVRGPVVRESAEAGAADFRARGAAARAEALLGRQSRPLAGPDERDAAVREAEARLAREPGLVAPGWTLHTVRPDAVEFWQGDRERRHTRLSYLRTGDGWRKQLLWP